MNHQKSNLKWNLLVIAAAMAATGTTASAQQTMFKATIPFGFSIGRSADLAPGSYVITRDRSMWKFRNEETSQTVLFGTAVAVQGRAYEKPSLTFECRGQRCDLRAIHAGDHWLGAEFPAPKPSKSEAAEVAVVNIIVNANQGQ